MNVPIIRLEVDRMKYTIHAALLEHAAQMDADVLAAIEAYCTPENIGCVIREEVRRNMDAAVKEEIRNFFSFGSGRKAVREAVIRHLDEMEGLYNRQD